MPFLTLFGGRVRDPTKIDHRKMGTLIRTSIVEDLVKDKRRELEETVRQWLEGRQGVGGIQFFF